MKAKGERQKAGDNPQGRNRNSSGPLPLAPKLADLGISKTQSSRWQKLADLSIEDFEEKAAHAVARMCLQRSGF
jgi:hypothetical protein